MIRKRIISVFLSLLLTSTAFLSSCSQPNNTNSSGDDENKTSDISSNVEETELARENTPDNLPEGLNFNGQKFTILSRNEFFYGVEMGVEEEIGEIVNDSIYKRNMSVEDRLNVDIDVVKIPGIWGQEQNFNSKITKSVKAGENAYNLVAGYAYFITPLAASGNFLNLKNIPYIEYKNPWWCIDLAEKMTIDDKLYFMSGDLSLTMIQSFMVMYFNKRLQQNYGVEDLYQCVLDGKWTYDKLFGITKDIYEDVNGDGNRDEGDTYGAVFEMGNYVDAFFMASDQHITEIGDDGYPKLVLNSPKTVQIVERMYELFNNNTGVYAIPEVQERPTKTMFINGQGMFNWGLLSFTDDMRDMKDDFGILPFPKFDENQSSYMSLAQDAYSLFCVPQTNTDLEFIGAVTEALAAESYRKVTPAYYETALKVKYSRDNITSQMLDIIRDGATFDFASVNSSSMDNIVHLFRTLMDGKKKDFTSAYEKAENKYEASIEKIVEAYKTLG